MLDILIRLPSLLLEALGQSTHASFDRLKQALRRVGGTGPALLGYGADSPGHVSCHDVGPDITDFADERC